jgi:hypothetical protein
MALLISEETAEGPQPAVTQCPRTKGAAAASIKKILSSLGVSIEVAYLTKGDVLRKGGEKVAYQRRPSKDI